ncbi:MAG: hypothetical protein IKT44_05145 [Clostridia bacterium]|nr:hypothetical protein [Clostridia bacterium]
MVILFSKQKSKCEKELAKILGKYGGNFISDKILNNMGEKFNIVSFYKKADVSIEKGVAVFLDKNLRFKDQKLPIGIVGICEENDKTALEIFKKSHNSVITCGINNKNTVTLSSISQDTLFATLQRSVYDINGNLLEPCELKIKLTENFSPFSVICSVIILLYHGIIPEEF